LFLFQLIFWSLLINFLKLVSAFNGSRREYWDPPSLNELSGQFILQEQKLRRWLHYVILFKKVNFFFINAAFLRKQNNRYLIKIIYISLLLYKAQKGHFVYSFNTLAL